MNGPTRSSPLRTDWPLWVSDVRPGHEHDTACARAHHGLLACLGEWTDNQHAVLADLGYQGENTWLTCPIKTTAAAGSPSTSARSTPCTPRPALGPTRERPAQDHLQGPTPGQPLPVADRRPRGRRARPRVSVGLARRTRLSRPSPGEAWDWFCGIRRPRGAGRGARRPWTTMRGRAVPANSVAD
jgi:hypothetical protein